jgi:hypothetical protein
VIVSFREWIDIVVDNCAICRNHIMDLCIECQANQASATSEECTVAWGVCSKCKRKRGVSIYPGTDEEGWFFYRSRVPLPLHLALAQDATGVPTGQPRVGVPEVRQISGAILAIVAQRNHQQAAVRRIGIPSATITHFLSPASGVDRNQDTR